MSDGPSRKPRESEPLRLDGKHGRRGATGQRHLRSVADEARRLGISPGWLYSEVRAGRFPCLRLGARVLLDPAEVDRFLDLRRVSVEEALGRADEDGL